MQQLPEYWIDEQGILQRFPILSMESMMHLNLGWLYLMAEYSPILLKKQGVKKEDLIQDLYEVMISENYN